MMVCMNEWAHYASIWVAPQKLELLSLFGTKAFLFCTCNCMYDFRPADLCRKSSVIHNNGRIWGRNTCIIHNDRQIWAVNTCAIRKDGQI